MSIYVMLSLFQILILLRLDSEKLAGEYSQKIVLVKIQAYQAIKFLISSAQQ